MHIQIPSSPSSYQIHFLEKFDELHKKLISQINNRNTIYITDQNVFEKTDFFKNSNINNINPDDVLVLKAGEEYKTWETVEKIIKFGFEHNIDRSSVLVAVGGGVVGDMVGFASSIYMRGVSCIQVPTTLLSMVDSSVGGKTGCDTEFGKNLIGAFSQPEAVFCTRQFFETLEFVELQNGMCEMIKHGILGSPKHFDDLEKLVNTHASNFKTLEASQKLLEDLFALVPDSVHIKKEKVEADEKEKGVRGHLNLGHTYGHAIELLSNFGIPHGIAVAKGIHLAFLESKKRGLLESNSDAQKVDDFFHHANIPLDIPYSLEEIQNAMIHDKKKKDGNIRLILPCCIGSVDYYQL